MISSITFLIQFLLISFTFAKDISFKGINLIDSYSRNQNCTDPSHYFLIEAALSIKKGSYNDDVFFSVPTDFDFFPTIPLNISNEGQVIASVYNHENNLFGINFPTNFQQDTTISFNLLTSLTNLSIANINIGDTKNYTFRTTTDNVFNSTINFVGKDTKKMTTNGGSFAKNNTAWFTADIPLSLLDRAVTFKSVKTGSNNYKYNVKATKLEVVTSFDSYGNPLTTVPFTAYKDESTADQIEISIDTRISGSGKFVRIHYFTEKLVKTPISNSVSLNQANSLKKRDLTDSATVTIYGSDLNDETASNVVVETPAVSSSTVINHVTAVYSNNTRLPTSSSHFSQSYTASTLSENTLSEVSTFIPTGLITTSGAVTTESSIATHSIQTVKSSIVSTSNVNKTSELNSIAENTISTKISSSIPITTTKSTDKVQFDDISNTTMIETKSTSAIVSTNVASTVVTSSSAIVSTNVTSTVVTSSSVIVSTNVTSTVVTSSSAIVSTKLSSTAVTSSSPSSATRSPISNITVEYTTDINGVVESKTLDAILSVATDLIPITTLSNGTVIESYSTDVLGTAITKTSNAVESTYTELVPITSIHNRTTTVSCSTETGATAITKTNSEEDSIYTELVSVRPYHNLTTTVSCSTEVLASANTETRTAIASIYTELVSVRPYHNLTTTVSCSTDISATVITKTQNGVESTATSLIAVGTIRNETSIHTGKVVSATTIAPANSLYTDLVPVSTLLTEIRSQITSTETSKHAQTQTISAVEVTSTEAIAVGTIQPTSPAPSVQVEAPKSIQGNHTTISVHPYEAGSNRIAFGLSSFIFAILATLL
ncbi:protein Egt2p [Monosporozyma servazzii]